LWSSRAHASAIAVVFESMQTARDFGQIASWDHGRQLVVDSNLNEMNEQ
jgi:hypothetical protein